MGENESFDLDEMMDELADRMQEVLEEIIDDRVSCAVQDALSDLLEENLANLEFVLKDGTIARPRQRMRLLAPDKTKLLLCWGGLRVDGTTLMVQTAGHRWESIACYQGREQATEALLKVKAAMEAKEPLLEL